MNFTKIKLYLFSLLICGTATAQVSKLDDKTFVVRATKENLKLIELLTKELDNNKPAVEVKVIAVQYILSSDLQPILQNVMSIIKPAKINTSQLSLERNNWNSEQHGVVLADTNNNQIILISDSKTISQLEKLTKSLDVKSATEFNEMIVKLKNAKSDSIANLINSIGGNNVSRRIN